MWNLTEVTVTRITLSGCVLGLGLVSNLTLAALLCCQRGQVNRLLVSLCLADLLVCVVSTPLDVVRPVVRSGLCEVAAFAQELPVGASTLSLSMLALERYSAIRPVCLLTRLRRLLAAVVWTLATAASTPIVLAACQQPSFDPRIVNVLRFTHLVLVYVLPCATVTVCHATVSYKLCDVSLSAAAARGEVPLPLPLLRHPRHVIIVASVAHDGPSKMVPYGQETSSGDEEKIRADIRRLRPKPGRPNSSPSHLKKHKVNRLEERAAPCFRRPQSLRSRRQLAVLLVTQVFLFASCWLPFVGCTICSHLTLIPDAFLSYSRLLGHAHSALNPVIYWFLNRHALPWPRPRLLRKLGAFQLQHRPNPMAAPSSTNEAALGAFHPRYTTVRPPPTRRVHRRRRRMR